ncbi:MAG: SigE family RNA polymerase sigma factor [Nocardioidaceae bacterium]
MSGQEAQWAAFSGWVEAGRDRWLRAAYLLTGDLARAEDLLQEGLVAVAKRWPQLADGHPEAYLRRCVYHRHVSWWRSRREVVVDHIRDVGYETTTTSEERLMLTDALAQLTPKQRGVLVLRFFEDLTETSTAEVLGVSVGTVKSQTAAALRRLRVQSPQLAELLGREVGP